VANNLVHPVQLGVHRSELTLAHTLVLGRLTTQGFCLRLGKEIHMHGLYSWFPLVFLIVGLILLLSGGQQILNAVSLTDVPRATPGALTLIAGSLALLASAVAIRQSPRQ